MGFDHYDILCVSVICLYWPLDSLKSNSFHSCVHQIMSTTWMMYILTPHHLITASAPWGGDGGCHRGQVSGKKQEELKNGWKLAHFLEIEVMFNELISL